MELAAFYYVNAIYHLSAGSNFLFYYHAYSAIIIFIIYIIFIMYVSQLYLFLLKQLWYI